MNMNKLYLRGVSLNNTDELTHSTHYDISDRLVMHDRDIPYGFKSLTDVEIEGYFSQNNFLDWLEGLKG